ncbi:hypothetical protein VP01_380g5 [Puccinia sorghi]|uniref:Uncharacterized protein n=1 Tax=Puccinia sorghi TaxID=27349 RepID=A0A0L6UTB8_9BASI|nr:hypothetical protein VP01_380g5 [Puccinia sorghi]
MTIKAILRCPIPTLTLTLTRSRPPRRALLRTFASSPLLGNTPSTDSSAIPPINLEAAQHTSSCIEQLADFLISQPLQPLSFTTTVILATILVRSTTTLPISIWSRLRINRFERIVLPSFKAFRSNLALRAKRTFLDPAQIGSYQKHLQSQLKRELDRLMAVNRCRPWVTIVGSLGIHVPVIYGLTTVLRTACDRASSGSPLAIEPSPILGASLLEPDLALALVCWAAFLANIELNASFRYLRRSLSSSSSSQPRMITTQTTSFISRGLSFWTPEKIRSASFLAGIGMMGISSSQPALVLIYWFTSNCFSILQSLCFIYLDHGQYRRSQADPNDPPLPASQIHPDPLTSSSFPSRRPQTSYDALQRRPNHLKLPSNRQKIPQSPSSSLPPII